MNYTHTQRQGNISGLAFVVALHLVVIYFLATAMVRGGYAPHPNGPIEFLPTEENIKPPPPVPHIDVATPRSNIDYQTVNPDPFEIAHDNPVAQTTLLTEEVLPTNSGKTSDLPHSSVSTVPRIACPNSQQVREQTRYPAAAQRSGIEGNVLVRLLVSADGAISSAGIIKSSNNVFNNTVLAAVKQFNCIAQGREVAMDVAFTFRLNE